MIARRRCSKMISTTRVSHAEKRTDKLTWIIGLVSSVFWYANRRRLSGYTMQCLVREHNRVRISTIRKSLNESGLRARMDHYWSHTRPGWNNITWEKVHWYHENRFLWHNANNQTHVWRFIGTEYINAISCMELFFILIIIHSRAAKCLCMTMLDLTVPEQRTTLCRKMHENIKIVRFQRHWAYL